MTAATVRTGGATGSTSEDASTILTRSRDEAARGQPTTTTKENEMPNRYNELTPDEQAAIDRVINHLASLPIDARKLQSTAGPELTADDLSILGGETL